MTIALDSKDDNPQRVFESINSTGKPLSDGDKIRNFALMLNSHEDRDYIIQKYWKNIEVPLTDPDKDIITDFFRSYIISKRQVLIPFGSVYPEFKKLFERTISKEQKRQDLDIFYSDILKTLEYYRLVKFGDDVSGRFAVLKNIAFKMRYIQIELYIPYALSVMRYYDEGKLTENELLQIFKLIETYFARRIVCNIFSTSVDRLFATLHKDVLELMQNSESETSYLEAMAYSMLTKTSNTRLPNEAELRLAVSNNQTYNQRKAHVNFLLTSIGDVSKESSLLKQLVDQEIKLTIEHIMPQTLTPSWRKVLGPEAEHIWEKYLHTLANLTLTGYNSEYSNRDFAEKKTMKNGFNESPLAINREIQAVENWNETALEDRRAWWIDNLEKVWPLPKTTYKPVEVDSTIFLLDEANLKGTKVRLLQILGDTINVSTWAQVLDSIVERAFELDEEVYQRIIQDEFLLDIFAVTDLQ